MSAAPAGAGAPPAATAGGAIGVEAVGITKAFGGVAALEDVSFRVRAGTVHALLGENGAGKSTLVKCLLGYHRADGGSFLVDGREQVPGTPREAGRLGLGMVYQHFTLVPAMTAAENLVMARADVPGVIDWAAEHRRLAAFIAGMPFRIPLDVPVSALAAGQRQKAEILKQLYLGRRLLVLDEPTSTLTPQEADEVLGLVRGRVGRGELTVIVITHKLREVAAFADAVTVLRRGRVAGSGPVPTLGPAALTALMIGESRTAGPTARLGAPAAEPRLVVEGLRTPGENGRAGLDVARLAVHPGEIVGIAGVSGNGQRELVEVLSGQRRPAAGRVLVSGAAYRATRAEAERLGVRVLPEEPLRNGCVADMSVNENLNLRGFDRDDAGRPRTWLDRRRMARRAGAMIRDFGIRAPSPDAPIGALSGGNVQRAVLARELGGGPRLLVVANPCFGLDVRAIVEVRARIVAARNAGAAVLLVSEDLDEILELSDRIVVMRDGRVAHEAPGPGADARAVGAHMVGHG